MRHIYAIFALCVTFPLLDRTAQGQITPTADPQWKTVFGPSWPPDSLGHLGSLFTTRPEPETPVKLVQLIENAQVRVSADVFDDLSRCPLDERFAVNEELLGVPLTGNSRLTGSTHVQLVESPDRGVFDIVLTGTIVSQTRGDAGRAQIHTRTVTKFAARKRILLDENGLTALPARCNTISNSKLLGTTSSLPGLRGRLARRISRTRAQKSLPEAEEIAARRAAARLCRQFDREAELHAAAANKLLREPLQLLAAQQGRRTPLRFYTTDKHLCVAGLRSEPEKLRVPQQMQDLEQNVAALAVAPTASLDLTTTAALLGTLPTGEFKRSLPTLARQVLPPELARALDEQKILDDADYTLRFAVDDGNLVVLLLTDAHPTTHDRPKLRLTREDGEADRSGQGR